MTGVPATPSNLTTQFPTTIGAGTFKAQNVQNVIASFVPWDDPTNASGLSAPAIVRGTVSTYGMIQSGLIVAGSGQTLLVRQANATALQNALNATASTNRIFEIVPGIYEISSSTGLQIPIGSSGFTWRGAMGGINGDGYPGSEIVQYYAGGTGAPVLTIGDVTGVTLCGFLDIKGVTVRYGFAPTGLISAHTLLFGGCAFGNFDMIGVQPGGSYTGGAPAGFNGYNGVVFTGGQFFSNHIGTMVVFGAQQNLFYATNFTTGNVFDNVYINNGGGAAYVPLAGSFMSITGGEVLFKQLNCEWAACNRVLDLEQGTIFVADILHCEGIKGTGYVPAIIVAFAATVNIRAHDIVDYTVLLANMSSTGACIYMDSPTGPSNFEISGLNVVANLASQVNAPIWIMLPNPNYPAGTYGINHGSYTIRQFQPGGTFASQYAGFLTIDPHMTPSASAYLVPQRFSHYEWAEGASTVLGAVIPVSATYTHYGQYEDATLIVPTSVTGFTITLAATMGASPSTQPVRTGCRVHVTRETGTFVGTVLVKDDAGTTLATLSNGGTTPTDYDFYFSGTHFVAFTAVPTGSGWIP